MFWAARRIWDAGLSVAQFGGWALQSAAQALQAATAVCTGASAAAENSLDLELCDDALKSE